VILPPENF
jgi:hypothetical protein